MQSPAHTLGLYDNPPSKEMYNDFPDQSSDFINTKFGLFRDDKYCNIHDLLMIQNQNLIDDTLFMTDYHQLSYIRMFILGKIGKDLMPKFSKDMPKINQLQPHLSIDPRVNLFYFKK